MIQYRRGFTKIEEKEGTSVLDIGHIINHGEKSALEEMGLSQILSTTINIYPLSPHFTDHIISYGVLEGHQPSHLSLGNRYEYPKKLFFILKRLKSAKRQIWFTLTVALM